MRGFILKVMGLMLLVPALASSQTFQGGVPTEFVGGADIREGSPTEVFQFQKFPRKEISVVHEGGQLGSESAELLADSRSTDDIGMRQVGDQLVDVVGAERHVAFAQQREFCI